MSPQPAMIDNQILRQTPEGVALSLMPAGVLPRMGAWIIDLLIRMAILSILSVVAAFLGAAGMGVWLIGYFLLDWFYPVLFEVFRHGQTIGKKQFGIQVCQDDGTPIQWQSSMIRNLLRLADFLPFAFFAGILSMLFNRESKRLGDLVAGTLVVYVPEINTDYTVPQHAAIALPMPLQLDEQQAILAFAERGHRLPEARRQELAGILAPFAAQSTPQTWQHAESDTNVEPNGQMQLVSQTLIGYANTIVGRA